MMLPILDGLPGDLWQRDAVLRHAERLLQGPGSRVRAVSLDFFDTLVWRWTVEPTGVFTEVGRRLQACGKLPTHIRPEDYRVYRRMAEVRARDRHLLGPDKPEDVTLEQVLAELQRLLPDPATAGALEIEAEQELCCVNPGMVQFAAWLKARGLRLFVVSDVYLSAEHLRGILRANGLDPSLFDAVYTSGDARQCKSTGNLFRRVLAEQGLKPDELLHLGDNPEADVAGAHRAGVRALLYEAPDQLLSVIFEREQFLLGAGEFTFGMHALRQLAARASSGDGDLEFFRRLGATVLGPVLTRFAGWACDQFAAAGVRRVGAFMREGGLLGRLVQVEAEARGLPLEVLPLYANRRSTELAALGRLTAQKLLDWLQRRQALPAREVLRQLGIDPALARGLRVGLDEKLNVPDRVVELARFLFEPPIARRIEQRSAEERQKVLDYLAPWLEREEPWGVCDLGYNASAQAQIHEILRLEGRSSRMVGCYVMTCEVAAQRALEGMDVRHYLGRFGHPLQMHWAFLRSPAVVEQLMAAPCGTTLGYERGPEGKVRPRLDKLRFSPELLERQKAFQDGVIWFQSLWLWLRRSKPSLLDGSNPLSQRLVAEVDAAMPALLARLTAFPLREELRRLGTVVLDDEYFDQGVVQLWGHRQRNLLRARGYAALLREQGVLWPQAVHQLEYPKAADEFFSYGSAMLGPVPGLGREKDPFSVTVVLPAGPDPQPVGRCLNMLSRAFSASEQLEVLVVAEPGRLEHLAGLGAHATAGMQVRVVERSLPSSLTGDLDRLFVRAEAPMLLLIRPDVELPEQGGQRMLAQCRQAGVGAVLPGWADLSNEAVADRAVHLRVCSRCCLIRKEAYLDAGGLQEEQNLALAWAGMMARLAATDWRMVRMSELSARADAGLDVRLGAGQIEAWQRTTGIALDSVWTRAQAPTPGSAAAGPQEAAPAVVRVTEPHARTAGEKRPIVVDWLGSFLDHGSLAHVNRELTRALRQRAELEVRCVPTDTAPAAAFAELARQWARGPASDADVTVRHGWPPNWARPARGRLVVIQPWEFGALPVDWVRAAADVDEFWVPSRYVRDVYVESGVPGGKVRVVPNGVDPARFHPGVPPRSLPTRKSFRFLFVGGTIFRKGPDLLLEAYLRAFRATDNVCLVIKDFGGRGPYVGQTLGDQIRSLQQRPDVPEILYLDEEWPPEDLPGLYTACHCLVLPYRGEGFGLPVLESMACGLPVIVTAGGATDDFVRDTHGWRLPARRRSLGTRVGNLPLVAEGWVLEPDRDALVRALQEAAADPEGARARGRKASEFARSQFSWEAAAKEAASRLLALAEADRQAGKAAKVGMVQQRRGTEGARPSLTLPACARLGLLDRARELWSRRDGRGAWQAVLHALQERPFHPEAYLLLAEIARAVGAGEVARRCLAYCRQIAPGYKAARKFALPSSSGNRWPDWMELPEPLRDPQNPPAPRLTVCLITRDEERFLGQCLESIRDLAHQIVVVDTGSRDRTVEIARAHGAEVHFFEWCDDFSAARNAALEHARGDWILVLDADEEVTEEGRLRLPEALRQHEVLAWRLPLVDVGREAEGVSYVPRLFRNAPGLFYVGRVHEQVFSSLEVRRAEWGLENRLGEVLLRHHGYRPEVVRDRNKIERNLRLLEQAVAEWPGEPHLLMHLGLELARSGRESEALERYREAFAALSRKPAAEVVPELRETLLTQLASRLFAARRYDEVIQVLSSPLARSHGGLTASLHFSLGLAYLERGQSREAADQMRQCLAKRDRPAMAPILPEIRTGAPHHCLALALWRLGDAAAAEEAFQTALQRGGRVDRMRLDYARFLLERQRPVEALQILTQCVTEAPDCIEAWRLGGQIALSRPEYLEFARDWTGEAMRYQGTDLTVRVQRASALLLSGEADAALPLWQQIEQESPQPESIAARLLCALGQDSTPDSWTPATPEPEVSRAFLGWYQRLARVGVRDLLLRVHANLARWETLLPTASRCLRAALAEVEREEPVDAG